MTPIHLNSARVLFEYLKAKFFLVFVVCFGALIGCGPDNSLKDQASDYRQELLATLSTNIYKGAPRPKAVTESEKRRVRDFLKTNANDSEIKLLRNLYDSDLELIAYALRDSDGDGIYDYRIGDSMLGEFFEGDVDIDGDGVRNVEDVDPFDPDVGFVDGNLNGIADCIDWQLVRQRDANVDQLSTLQKELFADYKILLVERSAEFPLQQAKIVRDALQAVFGRKKPFHSLRAIASENGPSVVDDGGQTNAMVMAPSQWMLLFRASFEMEPIIQLALLVHELTHNVQYDLDWDVLHADVNYKKSSFAKTNFDKVIRRFGWSPRAESQYEWSSRRYFGPLTENHRLYLYRKKTTKWWSQWINAIWEENGENYLENTKIVSKGIVGEYSLTDPLEWQADQYAATALMAIYNHASLRLDKVQRIAFDKWFSRVQYASWPGFRAQNIVHSNVFNQLFSKLSLSQSDLDYLVKTYTPEF